MVLNASNRIGLSLISTKISDLLLSPKTTLPALLNFVGAPAFFTQLLVPIRESGALLPQAIFARMLSNYAPRHRVWRVGAVLQVFASVVMLFFALGIEHFIANSGLLSGIGIVGSLLLWSVSRSLCSLINKDIQGEHIKEGHRGKLIGLAGTVSSFFSCAIAVIAWLTDIWGKQMGAEKLLVIGGLAVLVQIISLLIMWKLKISVDISQKNANKEYSPLSLSASLKKFIFVRSLFSHTALIAPFFTLAYTDNALKILAFLIVAQACAGFVSSYIWGRLADTSALFAMRLGATLALFACLALAFGIFIFTEALSKPWFIAGLFFLLSLGHNGVRTGRKIYSVDIADGHARTEFVAVSNTFVGAFILFAGFAYSMLSIYFFNGIVILMSVALAIAIFASFSLKNEK